MKNYLDTFLGFFLHFLFPYKYQILFLLFSMLVWASLVSYQPYILKEIIDYVVSHEGNNEDLFEIILFPSIIYVALFEVININYRLFDYVAMKIMPRIKRDIRIYMFNYMQNHSYRFFQNHFSGSLVTKIADTAKGIESLLILLIDPIFAHIAALLIAAVMMYFVHPLFCFILIIWSIIFISITAIFSKKSQYYSRRLTESNSRCMGTIVDSLTNIANVHLFAQNDYEHRYLYRFLQKNVRKSEALEWYILKIKIFQGTSSTLLMGSMMYILIIMRSKDMVTVGDFAFILTLSLTIVRAVWYLAGQLVKFSKEIGVCKQAINVIQIPHEIQDKEDAKDIKISEGEIKFNSVCFTYDDDNVVFKNHNIKIKAGEKIGLVGNSGAGKSTFISLILRHYDVDSGSVTIDGQDISEITYESLRKNIAVIPQETILFHRSIMENIRYGNLDASDEQVIVAAKLANCHEFIMDMEDEYNTIVGERGNKLSGGQRQRISIARAILKNAPILILDEATSALDSIAESKIQESLKFLMKDRTTIAIAHRLSTIAGMDRIIVFKNGKIHESGTHQQLLDNDDHYAELWYMQSEGFMP